MKTKRFVYELAKEVEKSYGLLNDVYAKDSIEQIIKLAENGLLSPIEAVEAICIKWRQEWSENEW